MENLRKINIKDLEERLQMLKSIVYRPLSMDQATYRQTKIVYNRLNKEYIRRTKKSFDEGYRF